MNLRYTQTITQPFGKIAKVSGLCWAPDGIKLAAAGADRVVSLYDNKGTRQDKFATKPADASQKNYVVKALSFSPDSTKLAVAQSDNIVFVYRIGVKFGERKVICNKFPQTSPVTCLCWGIRQDDIIFGLAEGKVRVGHLRSNKAETIYGSSSYVTALAPNPDRSRIVAGHLDGSLVMLSTAGGTLHKERFAMHASTPSALAFGIQVLAAGSDQRIIFYSETGTLVQKFEYTYDEHEKDYNVAAASPSGHSIVVGSWGRVFSHSLQRHQWEEGAVVSVPGLYAITSLAFSRDGAKLAVGSLVGAVEMYSASVKQFRYKGKFEMNYVSPSRVMIKRINTGKSTTFQTMLPLEIVQVKIYHDNYAIGFTVESLICADLSRDLLSEIPWTSTESEKFIFDNPGICMIYNAGELTLVEYGVPHQPLGSIRTEHISSHLISVRVNDVVDSSTTGSGKKIAYLIDRNTVRVDDLDSGVTISTITQENKIDWLQLDSRGTKLLFRDRRHMLHLVDLNTLNKSTLLNFSSYVQWVPDSDVIVAQNRNNLCVWYSSDSPERVTIIPINGDVIDIVRDSSKTEVIVDEGIGMSQEAVPLNEGLISFGSALEGKNYYRCIELLESMPIAPDTEALWGILAIRSLEEHHLHVSERCYAALGEVPRARFLHKVRKVAERSEMGYDDVECQTRLDILDRQFKKAEYAFLNQGMVEQAMSMYHKLHKYDEAISLAELKQRPEVEELRRNHYQWLVESGQEEKAALVKEKERDYYAAVDLYLQGGLPARAAQLVSDQGLTHDAALLERIAQELFRAGLYEKAGEFFEELEMHERALDAYRRGRSYRAALEMCRNVFPELVVPLELDWAEWLVSQKQLESAIYHFLEAGRYTRALEVALDARLWTQAVQIVQKLDPNKAEKYYKFLAKHYEDMLNFDAAEEYYVKGECRQDAVDMYLRHSLWDKAYAVAVTFLSPEEVAALYVQQANRLAAQGRLREAEKLFMTVNETDQAVGMYHNARKFDEMIRLVTQHRKEHLQETHLALAEQLDGEGDLKRAEYHYRASGHWKASVNMWRANDMWEEALRVARECGGSKIAGQVCVAWAKNVGGEGGINVLLKHGYHDLAISLALDFALHKKAEQLANQYAKARLPDVYQRHGLLLEEMNKFGEAEEEYIRANNPREAVLMYIHNQDWLNATHVAESFCPDSMNDILLAQAKAAEEKGELRNAEALYMRARRPELVVEMYRKNNMEEMAQRVFSEHMEKIMKPEKGASEVDTGRRTAATVTGASVSAPSIGGGAALAVASAADVEASIPPAKANYWEAVKMYLAKASEEPDAVNKALKLTRQYLPERLEEVLGYVSEKLIQGKQFIQLASLYLDLENVSEAISAYIQGGLFAEAEELARVRSPGDLDRVAQAELQKHAMNRDWVACLDVARTQGPEIAAKYASLMVQEYLESNRPGDACQVLTRYSMTPTVASLPIYKTLAREIITGPWKELGQTGVKSMEREGKIPSQTIAEFGNVLQIVILMRNLEMCCMEGLHQQAARCGLALLRHAGSVPADKAFCLSGMAAKEAGWPVAFKILNRYLDISEAVDDGEDEALANTGFENTDLPEDIILPKTPFCPTEKTEELRQWLLAQVSEGRACRTLPTRPCSNPQCKIDIFEPTLRCYSCGIEEAPCIVTGYPVLAETRVTCRSCSGAANKEDWNKFVIAFKKCPRCGDSQTPIW